MPLTFNEFQVIKKLMNKTAATQRDIDEMAGL